MVEGIHQAAVPQRLLLLPSRHCPLHVTVTCCTAQTTKGHVDLFFARHQAQALMTQLVRQSAVRHGANQHVFSGERLKLLFQWRQGA